MFARSTTVGFIATTIKRKDDFISFTIAVSKNDKTLWINCFARGSHIKSTENFVKGDLIYIEGDCSVFNENLTINVTYTRKIFSGNKKPQNSTEAKPLEENKMKIRKSRK